MTTDILKELYSKKPFREIEMPKELLENILLIPAELGPCPSAPSIKIERKLSFWQIKEMMASEEEKCKTICQVDMDANQFEIPTFKDTLIRKDLFLLAEIVATYFYSKIRGQKPDWDSLYQIVEIDWSLRDLCPGEQDIRYEIITKREIWILGDV